MWIMLRVKSPSLPDCTWDVIICAAKGFKQLLFYCSCRQNHQINQMYTLTIMSGFVFFLFFTESSEKQVWAWFCLCSFSRDSAAKAGVSNIRPAGHIRPWYTFICQLLLMINVELNLQPCWSPCRQRWDHAANHMLRQTGSHHYAKEGQQVLKNSLC